LVQGGVRKLPIKGVGGGRGAKLENWRTDPRNAVFKGECERDEKELGRIGLDLRGSKGRHFGCGR